MIIYNISPLVPAFQKCKNTLDAPIIIETAGLLPDLPRIRFVMLRLDLLPAQLSDSDLWKIAHISAIYKRTGQKNDKSNYRPISILPTLSKVCESIIHGRLLTHCIDHNIISERQAAYLKGDSTINQLLYIVHYIRKCWGHSKIVQGAFLDISAAFDKVWHNGLIAKLTQIGVDGLLLDMFKSYLSDRKQCVIVDGVKSTLLGV